MGTTPTSTRAGRYVRQPAGYRAFIPAPLPPDPQLEMSRLLTNLLSEADQQIGRLDGVAQILPDPNLFVGMYVRREAVLSSQIEGTQSTLDDILAFELGHGAKHHDDAGEVVNYVAAMNHGLARIRDDEFPLSLRLVREIHARLLHDVRGAEKQPGEFRRSQNWIGGRSPADAAFVPPPAGEAEDALSDLERFWHDGSYPALVQSALAHAQFETIHPFLDGNGRVGRLLITLLLMHRGVLRQPLIYLSLYFKRHRAQYYDRLQAVRIDGDWEGWLEFFLHAIIETSGEAVQTAQEIVALRERDRARIIQYGPASGTMLDLLFRQPLVNVTGAASHLGTSYVRANSLIGNFQAAGILRETTGNARNRVFVYEEYLGLLREPEDLLPAEDDGRGA